MERSRTESVSVVIPVHNAGKYLGETVASVMAQTFKDWELLAVNDHSTDSSVSLLQSLQSRAGKLRILECAGKGAACARNTGIKAAKGRFIAFLDADDLWLPEKLSAQLSFMREKDAAFSFTGYEFAGEDGKGTGKCVRVPESISYEEALKNTTIFTSTVMFDREKLSLALMLMPDVPSEDTATWWKILRNGHTACGLDKILTLYRRNPGSLSANKLRAVKKTWNLYRNVEHLGFLKSAGCFTGYAINAIRRRI
ncbi:MAG: glycosyltransferase family 2 protein [Lachnospiraceae bacterium]|nr:glycosyltransferase family 2 protein [Lachnospiraceae bacterium]